ncbi:MAG TPA: hypothetical protein VNH46_00455 [Gemmatimonadales bacterium]|nr:hypothetical protein [Gemmatimonadales bacterium]
MRTPLVLALGAAALVAVRHPTPTVVLQRQTEVIRNSLPDARQFFVRDVTIGKADLATIRREVDFSPEDPDLKFYLGKDGGGTLAGVVLFPQVNTLHGPIEVGLTMNADGAIASAVVTKATVETKPWVEQAVASGLLKRFAGMRYGDEVADALKGVSADAIGKMPYYEAEVITTAVHHGLVLYHVLYKGG